MPASPLQRGLAGAALFCNAALALMTLPTLGVAGLAFAAVVAVVPLALLRRRTPRGFRLAAAALGAFFATLAIPFFFFGGLGLLPAAFFLLLTAVAPGPAPHRSSTIARAGRYAMSGLVGSALFVLVFAIVATVTNT